MNNKKFSRNIPFQSVMLSGREDCWTGFFLILLRLLPLVEKEQMTVGQSASCHYTETACRKVSETCLQ